MSQFGQRVPALAAPVLQPPDMSKANAAAQINEAFSAAVQGVNSYLNAQTQGQYAAMQREDMQNRKTVLEIQTETATKRAEEDANRAEQYKALLHSEENKRLYDELTEIERIGFTRLQVEKGNSEAARLFPTLAPENRKAFAASLGHQLALQDFTDINRKVLEDTSLQNGVSVLGLTEQAIANKRLDPELGERYQHHLLVHATGLARQMDESTSRQLQMDREKQALGQSIDVSKSFLSGDMDYQEIDATIGDRTKLIPGHDTKERRSLFQAQAIDTAAKELVAGQGDRADLEGMRRQIASAPKSVRDLLHGTSAFLDREIGARQSAINAETMDLLNGRRTEYATSGLEDLEGLRRTKSDATELLSDATELDALRKQSFINSLDHTIAVVQHRLGDVGRIDAGGDLSDVSSEAAQSWWNKNPNRSNTSKINYLMDRGGPLPPAVDAELDRAFEIGAGYNPSAGAAILAAIDMHDPGAADRTAASVTSNPKIASSLLNISRYRPEDLGKAKELYAGPFVPELSAKIGDDSGVALERYPAMVGDRPNASGYLGDQRTKDQFTQAFGFLDYDDIPPPMFQAFKSEYNLAWMEARNENPSAPYTYADDVAGTRAMARVQKQFEKVGDKWIPSFWNSSLIGGGDTAIRQLENAQREYGGTVHYDRPIFMNVYGQRRAVSPIIDPTSNAKSTEDAIVGFGVFDESGQLHVFTKRDVKTVEDAEFLGVDTPGPKMTGAQANGLWSEAVAKVTRQFRGEELTPTTILSRQSHEPATISDLNSVGDPNAAARRMRAISTYYINPKWKKMMGRLPNPNNPADAGLLEDYESFVNEQLLTEFGFDGIGN